MYGVYKKLLLTDKSLRKIAYRITEKNCVPHRLSRDTSLGVYDSLMSLSLSRVDSEGVGKKYVI
jgi:hypothetical protein